MVFSIPLYPVYTIFKFSKLETVEKAIYIAAIEKTNNNYETHKKTNFFKSLQMIRPFLMLKSIIFSTIIFIIFWEILKK